MYPLQCPSIIIPPSESSKICEQSFYACEGKQDSTQRLPTTRFVSYKERASKVGRKCLQDGMVEVYQILDRVSCERRHDLEAKPTYMPKARLNTSQMMTIGAKRLPIFEVPKGWIKKSRIRMAHEVPTMVDLLISDLTTDRLYLWLIKTVRIVQGVFQSLPLYGTEYGLSRRKDSIFELVSEGLLSMFIDSYLTSPMKHPEHQQSSGILS